MKVIAINGSPKKDGNTACALDVIAARLALHKIELEVIWVGNKPLQGCIGCGTCAKMKNEECVFKNDLVNESIQKMKHADGILLASPVHFANMSGMMKCFLDRVFYVSGMNGGMMNHKVGSSLCVLRRSGGVETFNALQNYITYSQMLVATSQYWNVIHGAMPKEIYQDLEGIQILETLADNMAYLMKMQATSQVEKPLQEKKVRTNFIRS